MVFFTNSDFCGLYSVIFLYGLPALVLSYFTISKSESDNTKTALSASEQGGSGVWLSFENVYGVAGIPAAKPGACNCFKASDFTSKTIGRH